MNEQMGDPPQDYKAPPRTRGHTGTEEQAAGAVRGASCAGNRWASGLRGEAPCELRGCDEGRERGKARPAGNPKKGSSQGRFADMVRAGHRSMGLSAAGTAGLGDPAGWPEGQLQGWQDRWRDLGSGDIGAGREVVDNELTGR